MKKEYGTDKEGRIVHDNIVLTGNVFFSFKEQKRVLNKKFHNGVLTIENVQKDYYKMRETGWEWLWVDEMIKQLVEEIHDSIKNRFEILDIR